MRLRAGLLGPVVGALALLASGTALAAEIVDRRYVALPPVYPAPLPGLIRLQPGGAPLVLRGQRASSGRPVWSPARTEVVVGLDGRGRIIHVLEHTPGRFDR